MRHHLRYAISILLLATGSAIAAEFPPLSTTIADCENHWLLKGAEDPGERTLAFAYVDATAGVTLEYNGEVAIADDGRLVRKPNSLDGQARVIGRVTTNEEVACLSDAQAMQLGLLLTPAWLEGYRDTREPGLHHLTWAHHYNHIGASRKALEFVQNAIDAGFASAELAYEHGFALNVTEQFQQTLGILEKAATSYPDHSEVLAELAYAHMKLGNLQRGIDVYKVAFEKGKAAPSTRRAEYAQNIAFAFAALGDEASSSEWRRKVEALQSAQEAN